MIKRIKQAQADQKQLEQKLAGLTNQGFLENAQKEIKQPDPKALRPHVIDNVVRGSFWDARFGRV